MAGPVKLAALGGKNGQSEISARRAIGMAAEKMTDGDAENAPAQDPSGAGPVDACEQRYPDYLMDFPPDLPPEQVQHWQRFFNLREDILLDYGYQTARAYWADLQDIFEWAIARDKDVLTLTDRDLRQYCALLRRRKYSEATIRRRMVSWRKMEEKMKEG
jgi:phage integrase, N-terminal SAM-like domain